MRSLSRRRFAKLSAAGFAVSATPAIVRGDGTPKVVIVGGGAGGATAARYIAKDSKGALDVTLIDPARVFTTCFFSNLYLGGFRTFDSITHNYETLEHIYGIKKVTALAVGVDRDDKAVVLKDGTRVPYDRLVLSPGIDVVHESIYGYSKALEEDAPHAWKAGRQTQILKARLDALEDGQNIVMVTPPPPYRCPPAPYERASMMAHLLKAKGFKKSTITILDPKPKFSKQGLFQSGWEKYYPGMIEWIGPDIHGGIQGVNVASGSVETDFDTFVGHLLNIIPPQRASSLAITAGLTDDSGYCAIDPDTMRSQRDDSIFVIGDACIAGDMPKSGVAANSQAKVAAMNVHGDLIASKVVPAEYSNICWSLIQANDSVKVGAQYIATPEKIASTSKFVSQLNEASKIREKNYKESIRWYNGIVADMFG